MGKFYVKIVGVTFEGRQERIAILSKGQKLFWKHEFGNPYDSNAIKVFSDEGCTQDVGHIKASTAAKMIVMMREKKRRYDLFVENVIGGKNDGERYGLVALVVSSSGEVV
jgi:single-stranded-DNA-specific exonuclease